jgi:2-polyprenyl-3-methyl-5-hydroxy-6-metoxy-1,4-benzoquinol methylase
MSNGGQSGALTDLEYWKASWNRSNVPRPVDLRDGSLRNRATLALHAYFSSILAPGLKSDCSLIELGCAYSKWLPYFARHWGFRITGLDYLAPGCEISRRMLREAGVSGEVVDGDIFNPPPELLDRFDVVCSMGLVEHFEDTSAAVAACAAFAKPGGLVITIVPNLTGMIGHLQRALDRQVYEKHVALGPEQLRAAHETAGLSVVGCGYLLSTNLAIVNPGLRPRALNKIVRGGLIAATLLVWLMERVRPAPPSRLMSAYVTCAARRSARSPL